MEGDQREFHCLMLEASAANQVIAAFQAGQKPHIFLRDSWFAGGDIEGI